jgi:hypothetical protein
MFSSGSSSTFFLSSPCFISSNILSNPLSPNYSRSFFGCLHLPWSDRSLLLSLVLSYLFWWYLSISPFCRSTVHHPSTWCLHANLTGSRSSSTFSLGHRLFGLLTSQISAQHLSISFHCSSPSTGLQHFFIVYEYELTVHTGIEQKSSTDAKISVALYGVMGSSRHIPLRSHASTIINDPFQSGQ